MSNLRAVGFVLPWLLCVAGCEPGGSPPWERQSTQPDTNAIGDGDYVSQQGTLLLGFKDSGIGALDTSSFVLGTHRLFSAHVADFGEIVAVDSLLGRPLRGTALNGAEFDATSTGHRVHMRIVGVTPPTSANHFFHYSLRLSDGTQPCAQPVPLYGSSVTPPPPTAVAMAGTWSTQGAFTPSATSITLACSTGAVGKCHDWGYPEATVASSLGVDMLRACSRMARADYCADGVSFTVDGTPIHVHDVLGGPVIPEHDVPGFYLEAAWGKDAGTLGPKPLCLSKLRWSTLAPRTCPLTLLDPRIDPNGRYCEEHTLAEWQSMGALLFDDSQYIDAGLYSWTTGEDSWPTTPMLPPPPPTFTSSRLIPGTLGGPPEPRPGFVPPPGLPMMKPRFEGAVFNPDLENLPPDTTTLSSYFCPDDPVNAPEGDGDYITTTGDPNTPDETTVRSGCVLLAHEGYIYRPTVIGRSVTLYRYWNATLKRSRTTTAVAPMPPDWRPFVEGYLPR